MGRAAPPLLALILLAGGCGEDRPPAPPGADAASTGRDGGSWADAAGEAGSPRRDGGPVLPAADIDVVLPYRGPVEARTLSAEADLGALDVHFSIDTTGSFGEEIDAMQSDLQGRIVPDLRDRVEDVSFGVSRFEDFPREPFGASSDHPFELLTAITSSSARVGAAVAALDAPLGHGADGEESGAEALYQIATGEGYRLGSRTIVPPYGGRAAPGGGTTGGVGFREGALHVVVHVTDAPTHEPPDYEATFPGTHSLAEAAAALGAVDARVIGIASGDPARPYLEWIAASTGALTPPTGGSCPTGIDGGTHPPLGGLCPLVFDVRRDGTGLSATIVDAIAELVDGVQFVEVWGVALEDRLSFVRSIEAIRAEPPEGVEAPSRDDRRPAGDGVEDTFIDVRRGTRVFFSVSLQNDRVLPADYDQVFHFSIEIRGDGLVLTRRSVRVTVPRGRLDAGGMDAGGMDGGVDGGASSDGGPGDAAASGDP